MRSTGASASKGSQAAPDWRCRSARSAERGRAPSTGRPHPRADAARAATRPQSRRKRRRLGVGGASVAADHGRVVGRASAVARRYRPASRRASDRGGVAPKDGRGHRRRYGLPHGGEIARKRVHDTVSTGRTRGRNEVARTWPGRSTPDRAPRSRPAKAPHPIPGRAQARRTDMQCHALRDALTRHQLGTDNCSRSRTADERHERECRCAGRPAEALQTQKNRLFEHQHPALPDPAAEPGRRNAGQSA